jgi:hypothetical protein
LAIRTRDFGADRPVAPFRGFFDDRRKLAFHGRDDVRVKDCVNGTVDCDDASYRFGPVRLAENRAATQFQSNRATNRLGEVASQDEFRSVSKAAARDYS